MSSISSVLALPVNASSASRAWRSSSATTSGSAAIDAWDKDCAVSNNKARCRAFMAKLSGGGKRTWAASVKCRIRSLIPKPVLAESVTAAADFEAEVKSSLFAAISNMCGWSGEQPSAPSQSSMSACSIAASARWMPMPSITSSVAPRRPAVSVSTKAMPPNATGTSIRSRVVPAMSETIAASRDTSALSNVDFPLFGGPAMTTRKPSRSFSAAGSFK